MMREIVDLALLSPSFHITPNDDVSQNIILTKNYKRYNVRQSQIQSKSSMETGLESAILRCGRPDDAIRCSEIEQMFKNIFYCDSCSGWNKTRNTL
ncbi:hypothetical protein AVEN_4254-1 [Araneus ventricosus]|uniref:Uncharacterized protein n=1 Tax=Araneus ventricosus TaxID=182803 RepID=A0A4Y2SZC6_ARAVE|nr:hypothetical protein AVEN_117036-1 [Araneus ventricosus]GBN92980.1 hypothetical protein AVEN_4254-1 [Araneus ventricosus]